MKRFALTMGLCLSLPCLSLPAGADIDDNRLETGQLLLHCETLEAEVLEKELPKFRRFLESYGSSHMESNVSSQNNVVKLGNCGRIFLGVSSPGPYVRDGFSYLFFFEPARNSKSDELIDYAKYSIVAYQ
jgi:hypothetical protein